MHHRFRIFGCLASVKQRILRLFVSSLLLTSTSCGTPSTPEDSKPQPKGSTAVTLVAPPETVSLLQTVAEQMVPRIPPLSDGSRLELVVRSLDDLAMANKVGTSELPATLWLAPLSALAASVTTKAPGDVQFSECHSLLSASLGVAFRTVDRFSLPPNAADISFSNVFGPTNKEAQNEILLSVGSPRYTSSGLAALLGVSAYAANIPLRSLTADVVTKSLQKMQETQRRVRQYHTRDIDTLISLATKEGGQPELVLTTEPNVRAANATTSPRKLEWSQLYAPLSKVDYPLCSILTKAEKPILAEARKAIILLMASDQFRALLPAFGFAAPAPSQDADTLAMARTLESLITSWPMVRKPSHVTFVIDASVRTSASSLEIMRQEIRDFVTSRPSPANSAALVSASSKPEVVLNLAAAPEALGAGSSRFSTSGGNAIRDGIQVAFDLFGELQLANHRRAVVVFTSGADTSSHTTAEQILTRARQLVGRTGLSLIVIGLGEKDEEFGDLPATVRQAGGTFHLTSIPTFPSTFSAAARQVE